MIASMSRKGDCYDNAPIESFWGILKTELVHHRRFKTRQQAIQEITEYIEIFYNRQRKQKRLGYLSPAQFTQQYYQICLSLKPMDSIFDSTYQLDIYSYFFASNSIAQVNEARRPSSMGANTTSLSVIT